MMEEQPLDAVRFEHRIGQWIRANHYYAFKSGQWGKVTGVVLKAALQGSPRKYTGEVTDGVRPQDVTLWPCWWVVWPDGWQDYLFCDAAEECEVEFSEEDPF